MDVIKFIVLLFFLVPFISNGQDNIYPKDTIYLKFKDTVFDNPKMKAKSHHSFRGKDGVKFWWKGEWLFFDSEQKTDTLCYKHISDFAFTNKTEIKEKRNKWIFDNNRPPANRNGVFQTYLIEFISKEYFVIYPVIWRNEGVID